MVPFDFLLLVYHRRSGSICKNSVSFWLTRYIGQVGAASMPNTNCAFPQLLKNVWCTRNL